MTPDDYQKVKEIFQSVMEVPPDHRTAELDARCASDPSLRPEVERLLNSYESEFLESPVVANTDVGIEGDGLSTGSEIGHYTILKKIGSGGMGEVYLAEDGKLGRRVAIKFLPRNLTDDRERLGRFRQEARSASALNHPNILTIHEIGEADGMSYIATEFVDGETLRTRMNRGALALNDAVDIGVQCTSALDAAHDQGIIHRDIKPENIMIRRDNLVKILDFGLAKLVEKKDVAVSHDAPTEWHVQTSPGMIMGTVQYMSPEQARGHATDARTDIWSLGVVLYEMLAGQPPFKGASSADLIAEIVKTEPAFISKLVSGAPAELERTVSDMLRKDPDDRIQSSKDLLAALEQTKRRLDVKSQRPSRSRRYRAVAAGAAILLIAIIGTATYLGLTSSKDTDDINARFTYAANIRLAAEAIETSNLELAKQKLDAVIPKSGETDLRDFEWGYLTRLLAERLASQPVTLRHEGWVNSVSFSADGKTLATGSNDSHLWDASTGQKITSLIGHSKGVVSAVISPDGTKVATGSFDKTVKMWDRAPGQMLWSTPESQGNSIAFGKLAFSRDGSTISAEGHDRKVMVWQVSTGEETNPYSKFGKISHPFAISGDGKLLAAATAVGTITVFDNTNGRRIVSLDGKYGFNTDILFAPDSNMILTAGTDNIAKLWTLPAGEEIRTFKGSTGGRAFSPNGKTIAICNKGTIQLWDVEKGYEFASLVGHTNDVISLAFTPNGLKLASGSLDTTAKIWDVPSSESRGLLRGHTGPIKGISFSSDSKLLASAGEDKTARIWDVETERERRTLVGHADHVNSAAFSPDNRTLATGAQDSFVKIWDLATGLQRLNFNSIKPAGVFYSPDGRLIATAHFWDDDVVRLWSAATGELQCSFPVESGWEPRFSTDGRRITITGDYQGVKLWDTSSCAEVWSWSGGSPDLYVAVFGTNDKVIAFQLINNGRTLRMIDPESRQELVTFSGHEEQLADLEIWPNGNRLMTSDKAGFLKIWDIVTGQLLLTIKTNFGRIEATALSPDGKIIAAVGEDDQTIRIFRAGEIK